MPETPAIPLDVLRLAEDFCMEVGLSCSVRGFEALTAAISLGYLNPALLKSRDRRLFPAVAEAIQSPCCSKSIRRRIDFCIDSAFARNRSDITYKYFKNTIQPDKGNAVLLNGAYLFDCGIGYRALSAWLKDVSLVFLTHIHSDHFLPRTVHMIHRLHPLARFVCARNMLAPLVTEAGVAPDRVILMEPGQPRTVTGHGSEQVTIHAFPLVHDVENVGYVVSIQGGELDGSAMYATDTKEIPVSAPGLDLYMIEANWTIDGLRRRIAEKVAAGDFCYEERVRVSHLSREAADAWLSRNATPYKSRVVYLHTHIEEKGSDADGSLDSGLYQPPGAPEDQPPAPGFIPEW